MTLFSLPITRSAHRMAAQRSTAFAPLARALGQVMWSAVVGVGMVTVMAGTVHAQPQHVKGAAPQPVAVATSATPGASGGQADASQAPILSSPLPAGAAMGGLPAGTGPGYHSPNSPIAPLQQRADVVPWSTLSDLTKKTTKEAVLPVFTARQKALNKTVQRIQGFMVPLDAKPTQTHFLLTSVPLTCAFCIPGGPESMVEVKATKPVRYSLEPVVVEGQFTLLPNDQYGLYYRLVSAEPVK